MKERKNERTKERKKKNVVKEVSGKSLFPVRLVQFSPRAHRSEEVMPNLLQAPKENHRVFAATIVIQYVQIFAAAIMIPYVHTVCTSP